MAYFDAVIFRAVSNGTGDFVVSAAILGYRTPAAASVPNASTGSYRAESDDLTEWEEGAYVYTSGTTTVSRTVTSNSLGTTAKINFTVAPKVGFVASSADLGSALSIVTGTMDPNRLGSGVVGSGAKYLADNSTFKTLSGLWISTTQLLATNSSVTIPAGTATFRIRMQAAGGASAGHAAGPCGVIITGRPGGAGSYLEKTLAIVSGAINYTAGAVGTAGTSGDNAGGDAGNSTVVYNGVTYTAPGGKGGPVAATQAGAADSAVPTNGDLNIKGPGASSFGSVDLQASGKSPRYGGVSTAGANTGAFGGGAMGQRSASAQAGLSGLPPICEIDFYT